jgi:hypothetical protein
MTVGSEYDSAKSLKYFVEFFTHDMLLHSAPHHVRTTAIQTERL